MKQKLWITLATCLAYCIDKELYKAIDYLREQVRVLVEHQEKQDKRIRLTNSQRMRVAAKAKRLSRKMLEQCTELFTSDTIMRWFRELIAQKYDGSQNRTSPGRPQIDQEIVNLVIRFKEENPRWGYQMYLSSSRRTALRRPNLASKPFQEMARVGQGWEGAGGFERVQRAGKGEISTRRSRYWQTQRVARAREPQSRNYAAVFRR